MRLLIAGAWRHALDRRRKVAVVGSDGSSVTYGELLARAELVARAIGAPAAGEVVAISVPSGPDLWAAVIGTSMAGCTPALLPCPLPGLIAKKAAAELRPVTIIDDGWIARVRSGTAPMEPAPRADSMQAAGLILLSSGTTGHSRFIRRSTDAVDRIVETLRQEELCVESDVVASFLPMSHAYGFEHALLAPIVLGASVRSLGAFSIDGAVAALADGSTSLPIVPVMARALADSGCRIEALRSAVVAGAILPDATRAAFEARSRRPLVDLYGASELGTIWLDRGQGGRPVHGVEIVLRPCAHADSSSEGEVCVRSACMYEASFDEHGHAVPAPESGWFGTGDLGRRIPTGGFRVIGRKKLVFDVGGLKVNPLEIEQAVETHPAVRRALVYPLHAGSDLCRVGLAVEVPNPLDTAAAGATLAKPTLSDLRAHLSPLVPPHALPRSLLVTSRLPQTPSGKLLRDTAPEGADAAVGPTREDGIRMQHDSSIPPVVRRPKGLEQQGDRETYTKRLFDETAKGYDHSSGAAFLRSGRWYRRRMLVKAGLKEGSAHLDVGSGTGLCAYLGQQIVGPSGRVVALDPSTGMLEVAKRRGVRETVEGRAEKLPFPDATFDVVSMSYMLRHIEDLIRAFSEARRVLKPGGRIVIFEVTRPEGLLTRSAFDLAMWWVVPGVGVIASGRPSTFPMMRYWAETIEDAARPDRIVEALDRAGFVGTRHLLELGVFSCYRGTAPHAS